MQHIMLRCNNDAQLQQRERALNLTKRALQSNSDIPSRERPSRERSSSGASRHRGLTVSKLVCRRTLLLLVLIITLITAIIII